MSQWHAGLCDHGGLCDQEWPESEELTGQNEFCEVCVTKWMASGANMLLFRLEKSAGDLMLCCGHEFSIVKANY